MGEVIADTLSHNPELGVFSSMLGVALSPIAIISLISACLGLMITVITLIIKIMDIIEKIKRKKRKRADELDEDNYMVIEGVRHRIAKDEEEEEE